MEHKWIALSERRPTEAELKEGVTVGYWDGNEWETDEGYHHDQFTRCFTHFFPKVGFPPPPRKPAQHEQDLKALEDLAIHSKCWGREQTWFAALAYRDGQNREDLEKYSSSCDVTLESNAIDRIRRRCGLIS